MIIEKKNLIGIGVRLEPLSTSHINGLSTIIRNNSLWKMKETVIPHSNKLGDFLFEAETGFLRGESLVFAIIDTTTQRVAGCTRFRNISVAHKKAVIGPTFIGVDFQRTHVNTEAKYLMLNHAFEVWRFNRIELICDVLNVRSRNAIIRLGAIEEGIIRSDQVMPDGRIRDSALHSIIREGWLKVKSGLEEKREKHYLLLSA